MKYHIATRTRTRLFSYAICDTLEQAKTELNRYNHIWRIGIFEQDKLGNVHKVA
jgi:hypothetical protein